MKATINELFETGREIICIDDSDINYPKNFDDLKKCTNVLIGDKVNEKIREVLIDDRIYFVMPNKTKHQYGGTILFLEIVG